MSVDPWMAALEMGTLLEFVRAGPARKQSSMPKNAFPRRHMGVAAAQFSTKLDSEIACLI
jgi:hypothetical protein